MMGRITEAMINLRKRVDVVDVLILENNNIPHLPSRAFGSVAVNRLFIEHNGIARCLLTDLRTYCIISAYLLPSYCKLTA